LKEVKVKPQVVLPMLGPLWTKRLRPITQS